MSPCLSSGKWHLLPHPSAHAAESKALGKAAAVGCRLGVGGWNLKVAVKATDALAAGGPAVAPNLDIGLSVAQ